MPGPGLVPRPPGQVPTGRSRAGQAWALVPLLSFGMLAFVPFLRLALARRRPLDWGVLGGYLAGDVAAIVAVSLTAENSSGNTLAGGLLLLLAALGTVHTLVAFRPGWQPVRVVEPPDPEEPNREAVTQARERMKLRDRARKLAADDPVMARELKIGRPDLPRDYDDGGLVDVNHVPGPVLAARLGLTDQEVTAVLAARDRLGEFTSPDELSAYAGLAPDRTDDLKDWLLFG